MSTSSTWHLNSLEVPYPATSVFLETLNVWFREATPLFEITDGVADKVIFEISETWRSHLGKKYLNVPQ